MTAAAFAILLIAEYHRAEIVVLVTIVQDTVRTFMIITRQPPLSLGANFAGMQHPVSTTETQTKVNERKTWCRGR